MQMKMFGWLILGCVLFLCPSAMAQDSLAVFGVKSKVVFSSSIIGSTPDQTVAGVQSGTLPWVVRGGSVTITADGKVVSSIKGLVIPQVGVGPVTKVAASLVCGGSGGSVAATTRSFPLQQNGDTSLADTINLPANCVAPVVLIRITALTDGDLPAPINFIASSGFGNHEAKTGENENGNGSQNGNNNND